MAASSSDFFQKVGDPGTATTLSAPGYTIGDTSINIGSTANWPSDTGITIAIDEAEVVDGVEVRVDGTYNEYRCVVATGTSANQLVWARGDGNRNYAAGALTRVYIPISAERENRLVEGILEHSNQDGSLITQAVRDALSIGDNSNAGWEINTTSTITAVTNNGNRSYTLTHSASVAAVISEGMRRRFTRTVATNTYMGGAFNGSSHYFTKTTPGGTLGTVTNNFTIEVYVQPTSYVDGIIAARADATPNNGLVLRMSNDGTVWVMVVNGGNTNYRILKTYQSLPLNKKTHVAASWASGTVVIYFDGVAVPVSAAATGGTAPTTAGTGGDFSVGRYGAYASNYFAGYISNVAVFDAVLSAATIREHATRKLLGNETNCIGAWSLDNTANDQNSAGNNLTATGGVGFSNVSPFGNNGKSSTLEYGLTMSVSADGLTEVVQVPEGCALGTAITSQDYSTQGNPFGWVSDKGRWGVTSLQKTIEQVNIGGLSTWWASNSKVTVPIGSWTIGYQGPFLFSSTVGGIREGNICLSSGPTNNVLNAELVGWIYQAGTAADFPATLNLSTNITLGAATVYTIYGQISSATGAENYKVYGIKGAVTLWALPTGL